MTKKTEPKKFAVCINNEGYGASLEAGKLYQVIPDLDAEKHGLIRVIDESGEDYGYSAKRFFALAVPMTLEKLLRVKRERSKMVAHRRRKKLFEQKTHRGSGSPLNEWTAFNTFARWAVFSNRGRAACTRRRGRRR